MIPHFFNSRLVKVFFLSFFSLLILLPGVTLAISPPEESDIIKDLKEVKRSDIKEFILEPACKTVGKPSSENAQKCLLKGIRAIRTGKDVFSVAVEACEKIWGAYNENNCWRSFAKLSGLKEAIWTGMDCYRWRTGDYDWEESYCYKSFFKAFSKDDEASILKGKELISFLKKHSFYLKGTYINSGKRYTYHTRFYFEDDYKGYEMAMIEDYLSSTKIKYIRPWIIRINSICNSRFFDDIDQREFEFSIMKIDGKFVAWGAIKREWDEGSGEKSPYYLYGKFDFVNIDHLKIFESFKQPFNFSGNRIACVQS